MTAPKNLTADLLLQVALYRSSLCIHPSRGVNLSQLVSERTQSLLTFTKFRPLSFGFSRGERCAAASLAFAGAIRESSPVDFYQLAPLLRTSVNWRKIRIYDILRGP